MPSGGPRAHDAGLDFESRVRASHLQDLPATAMPRQAAVAIGTRELDLTAGPLKEFLYPGLLLAQIVDARPDAPSQPLEYLPLRRDDERRDPHIVVLEDLDRNIEEGGAGERGPGLGFREHEEQVPVAGVRETIRQGLVHVAACLLRGDNHGETFAVSEVGEVL